MTKIPLKPATMAAQALRPIDKETGAIIPPIHVATTFERDADTKYSRGEIYARWHSPAFTPVENLLAALEEGADARVFATGMAAATAVFQALRPGDHVVVGKVIYYELQKWLTGAASEWGLDVSFVDTTDLEHLGDALRPGATRLVWIETPSNPLWGITDIEGAAVLAHDAGARLVVDSTCATPMLTRPLGLGADVVMHSATKYLNGHSDLTAGALITARKDAFWERISQVRLQQGAILGPFEASQLLRGMRTLSIRMRTVCENASTLARRLEAHVQVGQVLYPGLESHAGHAVAARQMQGGFGGMISIRVNGGEAGAIATAANVDVWTRATSLGSVESLIEHRASIETADTTTPRDLLRLSVGIEDPGDLYDDLNAALEAAH